MRDAGGHKAAAKAGEVARKGTRAATRDERRAAELRANLLRRKQQAREKARPQNDVAADRSPASRDESSGLK
jgi:hypothetical protein